MKESITSLIGSLEIVKAQPLAKEYQRIFEQAIILLQELAEAELTQEEEARIERAIAALANYERPSRAQDYLEALAPSALAFPEITSDEENFKKNAEVRKKTLFNSLVSSLRNLLLGLDPTVDDE